MYHCIQTKPLNFKQQEQQVAPSGYMPGLDGLRALAVLAVLAYHLDLSFAPGGLLGVNLFFVLSGYLITSILLAEQEQYGKVNLKKFWMRRIRRLLPALFLMLMGVATWLYAFAPERLISLKQEILAVGLYVSNWYLIFHEVSYFEQFGPVSPFGHLWSLAIEEQFYLAWPILLTAGLWIFPRKKPMVWITILLAVISTIIMALIYMPGQDPSRVYYGTDTRAFALLVGAILAMICPRWQSSERLGLRKKLALDTTGIVALAVILWMMLKTNQYQSFLYQGGLLLFSVATACLVAVLAHPASGLGKFFGWKPLRWLGECSYGIYLWHYPVIVLTNPIVNTNGASLSRSLMQIGFTIVLAALSRYLVEDPIRYGRKKHVGRSRQTQQYQPQPQHQYQYQSKPQRSTRRRPLTVAARISVCMLVIFSVLFATTSKSSETLAIDESDGTAVITADAQIEAMEVRGINALNEIDVDALNEADSIDELDAVTSNDTMIADEATTPDDVMVSDEMRLPDDVMAADEAMEENREMDGSNITVIGDSLMVGVQPFLKERLPGITVDAKENRQMREAPGIIANLHSKGNLKKIVIIELGTNGPFTEKQLMEMLEALKDAEQIFLINARVPKHWETVVNETLANTAERLPDITLIDWYHASGGQDEYFYSDGVHVNAKGANAYCDMIIEALHLDGTGLEQGA